MLTVFSLVYSLWVQVQLNIMNYAHESRVMAFYVIGPREKFKIFNDWDVNSFISDERWIH